MNGQPKISVIVPTRNRARTLRHTLRTCLSQTFDDFEVIVSDNFSDDETQELLASIDDPRLRPVRTKSYISMARNFQNGLAHARGEAILFIGDDDGLLPFGLELLARALDAHPEVDAVRWRPPNFWWPHKREYDIRLPAGDFALRRHVEPSADVLPRITHPKIFNFFEITGFTLYHGCWRRHVADRAIADGVDLFEGPIPDVLSSIYGLRYARACLCLEAPVSIIGVSSKSNGWATSAIAPTEEQKILRADFAERSRRDYPDAVPITFSFCACSPYLGSLLTYWLGTHADLAVFDHEAWREIFLNQLVFFYDSDEDLLSDYAAHVGWLRAHGAQNVRPITREDADAYRKTGTRMRDVVPAATPSLPSAWRVLQAARKAPRSENFGLRFENGVYVGKATAGGDEFTVADFADLYTKTLGLPTDGWGRSLVANEHLWEATTLQALEQGRLFGAGPARFLTQRVLGR